MYTGASATFYNKNSTLDVQKHALMGLVGSENFGENDIVAGSFSYSASASEASSFQVGGARIGVINCTFFGNFSIGPRSWRGKEIVVYFGLCVSENPDTYEYIPLCRGIISEATVTAGLVKIKAYDNMALLDKDLPVDDPAINGTAFTMLNNICQECGIDLGNTQPEIEAMPNGTEAALASYMPNDCKTYRDFVYWISQVLAGFATIGRDGYLYIRSYAGRTTPDATITENDRLKGASVSDYITQYQSVNFGNLKDGTSQTFGSGNPIYYAGNNPFLQYGTKATLDRQRKATADAVRGCAYMPFSLKLKSAPIYDLGDVLLLTGGIVSGGRQHIGIVQSITYTAGKELLLQGFGRDPMQKPIENRQTAENSAKSESNTLSFYDYKNDNDVIIPESAHSVWTETDAASVIKITFVAQTQTIIEVINEINSYFYAEVAFPNPCNVAIAYYVYVDGELQTKQPIIYNLMPTNDLWRTGADYEGHESYRKDVFDTWAEVTTPGTHTYEIKAVCKHPYTANDNTSLVISPALGIYALLKGQGLIQVEVWDGYIFVSDEIAGKIPLLFVESTYSDSVYGFDLYTCMIVPFTDQTSKIPLDLAARTFDDFYLRISFIWPEAPAFGDFDYLDNDFIY